MPDKVHLLLQMINKVVVTMALHSHRILRVTRSDRWLNAAPFGNAFGCVYTSFTHA